MSDQPSSPTPQHDRSGFLPTSLQSPLTGAIVVLLAWLPVNIWVAVDPRTAWEATAYLLIGIVGFGVALWTPRLNRAPEKLAWLLIGGVTLLAVAAIPFINFKEQLRLFDSGLYLWLEELPVPRPETIHSNVLASAVLQVAPLALAMVAFVPRGRERTLAGAISVTLVSILILTQARGALLGFVAALLVMCVFYQFKLLWLLIVPVIGLWIGLSVYGIQRVADAFVAGPGMIGGGSSRMEIWTVSYLAISDFPITGIGIGAFPTIIPIYYPLRVDIVGFPHAHNLVLQVGLDTGLPGLVAYLAILLIVLFMLTVLQRRYNSRRLIALGLLGSTVAMLVDGIFSTANWGTKLAFIPWLLYALTVIIYRDFCQHKIGERKKSGVSPGR